MSMKTTDLEKIRDPDYNSKGEYGNEKKKFTKWSF